MLNHAETFLDSFRNSMVLNNNKKKQCTLQES
jgi:hypothetical protein